MQSQASINKAALIEAAVEAESYKCSTTKLRIVSEACECCNHLCRIKVILNLIRSIQVASRLKPWLVLTKTSQGPAEALGNKSLALRCILYY